MADPSEETTLMKGKLSLAAVAVAFVTMAVPGTASAHFDRYDYRSDWCKRDCMFGWMHRWDCQRKVGKHRHKHHVHKRAKVLTK
jgi:hypothetical protein